MCCTLAVPFGFRLPTCADIPSKTRLTQEQSRLPLKIKKHHSNRLQLSYIMKGCCQAETCFFWKVPVPAAFKVLSKNTTKNCLILDFPPVEKGNVPKCSFGGFFHEGKWFKVS